MLDKVKSNKRDIRDRGGRSNILSLYLADLEKRKHMRGGKGSSPSHYKGKNSDTNMFEENLSLVASIANRYRGRGLAYLDLIQEGNIGLLKMQNRLGEDISNNSYTYASYWIHQAMTRAIDEQGHMIRVPLNIAGKMKKIGHVKDRLAKKLSRKPTLDELVKSTKMDKEELIQIMGISEDTLPIDSVDINRVALGDLDENDSNDLEETALNRITIDNLMLCLDSREREVFRMRFGLDDNIKQTLQEIGDSLGLTKERVRQIESKALDKLRRFYSNRTDRVKRSRGYSGNNKIAVS